MKKFLDALKEECLAGVWSKGVQASRNLKSIEKTSLDGNSGELRFKVTTPERILAFEVTLWPEEQDAHCNCGSKVEPCHHIVAAALAFESGLIPEKSESDRSEGLRLEYSWIYQKPESGKSGRLTLKRALKKGETELPLPASLIAWVGGVKSGRIEGALPSLTPNDLKIDGLYAASAPEWKVVLGALSDLPPLPVSGHPVHTSLRIQRLPERPKPVLRELSKNEWSLDLIPDPDLEVLHGGLWIKNGVLGHGYADADPYPKRFNRIELETSLLRKFPELKNYFPSVIEVEPELKLTLHPLPPDQFSATLRIHYETHSKDDVILRDPKKESELAQHSREHLNLIPGHPKTLSSSELLNLYSRTPTLFFQEIESVLGSYLKEEFNLPLSDALKEKETILKLLRLKEKKKDHGFKIKTLISAFAKEPREAPELSMPTPSVIPPHLKERLRPYQLGGVNWLFEKWKTLGGAILADDMGLGKTLQTLAVLESPSLVVVPVSLLQNWKNEAARFRPELKVAVYHGAGRAWNERADVVLTSYSLLGAEADRFASTHWKVAALDEAHIIRNPETRAALASATLTADFRLALTGTPIQNRLRDLWSLFQFVSPGLFDEEASLDLMTSKPFFLRRTKAEVLTELPPKTHLVHSIPFTESESKVYQSVFDAAKQEVLARLEDAEETLSPLTLFEVLLRARQACNHRKLFGAGMDDPSGALSSSSKIEAILTLASDLLESGHSALVYSQWTGFLDLLEARAERDGLPYHRLDGSTRNRGKITEAFQESDRPSLFLLSLHAGGVGLNLTRASHVIFCEPWWKHFVELQAEDRAYRMGQEKPVTIHRFRIEGSIEERMGELQAQKLALGEGALSTGDLKALVSDPLP